MPTHKHTQTHKHTRIHTHTSTPMFPISCAHAHTARETSAQKKTCSAHKCFSKKCFGHNYYFIYVIPNSAAFKQGLKCYTTEILCAHRILKNRGYIDAHTVTHARAHTHTHTHASKRYTQTK